MIVDATLPFFRDEDEVDPYTISSFNFRVNQKQQAIIESQQQKIIDLEFLTGVLSEQITGLQDRILQLEAPRRGNMSEKQEFTKEELEQKVSKLEYELKNHLKSKRN